MAGLLSIVFGALLVAMPAPWLLAVLALAFGGVTTLLAVRLRALAHGAADGDEMVATA
jgi:hypothetical protein